MLQWKILIVENWASALFLGYPWKFRDLTLDDSYQNDSYVEKSAYTNSGKRDKKRNAETQRKHMKNEKMRMMQPPYTHMIV